jgi:DUF2971 family protein
MWRGYGGNGKGVALVIDTSKMTPVEGSPLVLSHVVYDSAEARRDWLAHKIADFAGLLKTSALSDEKLYLAAWVMFQRIKLFSLFSKHRGFCEVRPQQAYSPNHTGAVCVDAARSGSAASYARQHR